jgi:hypothetical protein
LIATGSGVLSFLTSGGLGSQALRIIAVVALVTLLVLVANEFLVRDRAIMKKDLSQAKVERDRYRSILQRIIDRQGLNYEERLEVHAYIGVDDAGDRIVERHVTTPTPRLYYRSLRPVVPSGTRPRIDDLGLEVKIHNANGVRASVSVLSDDPLRILVMFDPAIDHTIEWTLAYRSEGLWAPLRKDGVDELSWDARTPSGRQDEYTFTEFDVIFHFPKGVVQAQAGARTASGTYAEATDTDGTFIRTWKYTDRVNQRMTWDLTMEPTPLPAP